MYLVRAMQLEPLAKSPEQLPAELCRRASISTARAALRVHPQQLRHRGGRPEQPLLPDRSLTRAEMAVMLRRAIDFMDDRGIYAELPAYTDYDWTRGRHFHCDHGGEWLCGPGPEQRPDRRGHGHPALHRARL